MEFNEKLQELRKNSGLTQEELAEILYVSRTAVSKWESGRGYPNIESLKEISRFFSVSIDDLLSGEKLLSIAEKENRFNIKSVCNLLFGFVDLFYVLLVFLPLYPYTTGDYVYAVSLLSYKETVPLFKIIYLVIFGMLVVTGVAKIIVTKIKSEKAGDFLTAFSVVLGIATVLLLAITRETYAVTVAFLLLIVKGGLLLKLK